MTALAAEHAVHREEDAGGGLVDLLLILAARKGVILLGTLLAGLAAAAIAFLLPNTYTASAVVMPPQQQQTGASAMLGQLGPLAAAAGKDLGLKTPGELYIGLLGSRTIADRVIERFGLRKLYEARTMVDARVKLRNRTRFTTGKDSLVHLEVDDRDPGRAAAIANMFADELNLENTGFGTTEAGQRRVFLEKQVKEEKEELTLAEAAMRQTQSQTGLIQVDAQATVAIGSVAQLRAQIAAGEVALQRLRAGATSQNPEVVRLEIELDTMRRQLQNMESKPRSGGAGPVLTTSAMPQAGLEYLRHLRDVKYHEFLFEILSKQYEAARMDEIKASPSIQIVDRAVPPDQKSGPHRGLMIAFGLFAGFTLSSIGAYLAHGGSDAATKAKWQLLSAAIQVRDSRRASVA
jgi:uncharacterized protein involved in exopolysaccharide biosynthesis